MTHDDFTRIEWTADRAMRAIGQFADKQTRAELARASYILAEVRNAAQYLCAPDDEHSDAAIDRLLDLFRHDF